MAIRINIRKIFSVLLWCILGAGVLVLFGAAIGYRNNKVCKGYNIEIATPSSGAATPYIGKKEIVDLLSSVGAGQWQGRATTSFDLRRMESVLEKNVWIRDAELFFDNNGMLRVNVAEREPIARVFTQDGKSWYIDSGGMQLPLLDRLPARLPVFTGYPSANIRRHGADSVLTDQIRRMGAFVGTDSFWMAQIAQINIKTDRTFQLVPVIGNHLVEFGDGSDCEQKLHRLFVFYKEVLSKTGFDAYSKIDVAYAGQVVATRKGSEGTRTDSLQGIRNIQDLIRNARQMQPDTVHQRDMRPLERPVMTEQSLTNYDLIPGHNDSVTAAPAQERTVTPMPARPTAAPRQQSTGPKPAQRSTPHRETGSGYRAIMPKKH